MVSNHVKMVVDDDEGGSCSSAEESSEGGDYIECTAMTSQTSVKDLNISAGFLSLSHDICAFLFLSYSVQSGSLVVRRLPLLPLLRCKATSDTLWRPFVSPCASMRTHESDALLRRKTLGVRRVRSSVPAAFSPVSPPKDEALEPKTPESATETFESDFVRISNSLNHQS